MAALPGLDDFNYMYDKNGLYYTYIALYYIKMIIYIALLVLCLVNIYAILYRQGRWRTMPLLFFYIYALIAAIFKNVVNVFYFTFANWSEVLYVLEPIAKFNVGAVQIWIIIVLTC